MRVSCSCARDTASEGLVKEIAALGLQPIVTNQIIRGVYEGDDHNIGGALVTLFSQEQDHDVFVHFDKGEIDQYKPQTLPKQPKQHPRSSRRKKHH